MSSESDDDGGYDDYIEAFIVERVVDMRREAGSGRWEYLFRWKDASPEEDAWQLAFHAVSAAAPFASY